MNNVGCGLVKCAENNSEGGNYLMNSGIAGLLGVGVGSGAMALLARKRAKRDVAYFYRKVLENFTKAHRGPAKQQLRGVQSLIEGRQEKKINKAIMQGAITGGISGAGLGLFGTALAEDNM